MWQLVVFALGAVLSLGGVIRFGSTCYHSLYYRIDITNVAKGRVLIFSNPNDTTPSKTVEMPKEAAGRLLLMLQRARGDRSTHEHDVGQRFLVEFQTDGSEGWLREQLWVIPSTSRRPNANLVEFTFKRPGDKEYVGDLVVGTVNSEEAVQFLIDWSKP